MLRNKNVTLSFLLPKDVSFMIRIKDDTTLIFYPQWCVVELIINRKLGALSYKKSDYENLTDSIITITWDGIKCDAVAD